jgi:hypothetical protein
LNTSSAIAPQAGFALHSRGLEPDGTRQPAVLRYVEPLTGFLDRSIFASGGLMVFEYIIR